MLPTEAELSQSFDVSAGTIRQALAALVDEGLLTRMAGKGTFVSRIDGWRSFDRFFGFRGGMGADDKFVPDIQVLESYITDDVSSDIRTALGLKEGKSVFVLRRLLRQDDLPVCVISSYLPYHLVPGIEKSDLTQRLYPLLERDFGRHVVRATEILGAGAADKICSDILGIKKASPIITIDRMVHTYKDIVLEYRQTVGRNDKFRYRIRLR